MIVPTAGQKLPMRPVNPTSGARVSSRYRLLLGVCAIAVFVVVVISFVAIKHLVFRTHSIQTPATLGNGNVDSPSHGSSAPLDIQERLARGGLTWTAPAKYMLGGRTYMGGNDFRIWPVNDPVELIPGERFNKTIVDYLRFARDFNKRFPGFETDIHGLVSSQVDGQRVYFVDCVKP